MMMLADHPYAGPRLAEKAVIPMVAHPVASSMQAFCIKERPGVPVLVLETDEQK
jgi:hypothetical protein